MRCFSCRYLTNFDGEEKAAQEFTDTSLGILPLNGNTAAAYPEPDHNNSYFVSSEATPHILRRAPKKKRTEYTEVNTKSTFFTCVCFY